MTGPGDAGRALEQPPAAAEDDGVDEQPVLVHEPPGDELVDERDAPG